MTQKVRKQIYLEPEQDLRLKHLASATGLSEAEIIRRTLDSGLTAGLVQPTDLSAWLQELEFIENLIASGPIEGGRMWKREDAYEQ